MPGRPWAFLGVVLFSLCVSHPAHSSPLEITESSILIIDPDTGEILWRTNAFRFPMGVRALPEDRILVSDFGTARVAVMDREEKILAEYPANNPEDARVLPSGDLLIVHNGNSRITLIGPEGGEQKVWENSLDHPAGAFISGDGILTVADTNHKRIVRIDQAGGETEAFTQFLKPMTLEPVGTDGFLFADSDTHKIGEWSLSGTSRWELTGFRHPTDAKMSPTGNIVVADSGNFRVVEVNRSGKSIRSLEFTQKPVALDLTEEGHWLVAIPFDPNLPRPAEAAGQIAPSFAPLTETARPSNDSLLWATSPIPLFVALLVLVFLFIFWLKGRSHERDLTVQPVSWIWWVKGLGIVLFSIANLALIHWYFNSSELTQIRLVCAPHRIDIFFGEQNLGSIAGMDLPSEGEIGVTMWQEGKNHQKLASVSFTPADETHTKYSADFTARDLPKAWTFDPSIWNHEPGEGITTPSRNHQDIFLRGKQFGTGTLAVVVENPAELGITVRMTSPLSYTRFYLRPQRHLDTWVETRKDGRKVDSLSRSLARVTPSFESQVRTYLRLVTRHYFFAWFLLGLGAILYVIIRGLFGIVAAAFSRNRVASDGIPGLRNLITLIGAVICSTIIFALAIGCIWRAHWVSESVLQKVPHLQDSVAYLFQGKILAGGSLYVDSPPSPYQRFFDHEFIVNNGKRFGLYTPGFPLMLAVGLLLGDPWWVNPILAGLSVIVIFLCGWSLYGMGLGVLAAILLALSPWFHFMSGTMISHPASLLCTLIVILGLSEGSKRRGFWPYVLAGTGLGMLILVRSGNSLVVGIPALLWSAVHLGTCLRHDYRVKKRGMRLKRLVSEGTEQAETHRHFLARMSFSRVFIRYFAMGAVCIAFISFLAYYNWRLTGDPRLSTYNAYSPHIRLGFGPDVGVEWGTGHDRLNAINNLVSNLNEFYRFWYTPASQTSSGWEQWLSGFLKYWMFAPVIAVFIFLDRRPGSYLLLALILGTLIFQYCYFHSGISYGARFYYDLLGPLSLLSARGCWICASFIPRLFKRRQSCEIRTTSFAAAGVVTVLLTFPLWTPSSFSEGTQLIQSFRNYNGLNRRYLDLVKGRGLNNAVVLVDSKGSWIPYGNVFWAMSPWLDDPVVFARDQGIHNVPKPGNTPLDNKLLLDLYPDRSFYLLEGNSLRKLDWSP
jgi:sugar lactone lactonase YvrE